MTMTNLAEFPNFGIMWVIVGEFDNFGQIQAFKCNFGPIDGLESMYCGLL